MTNGDRKGRVLLLGGLYRLKLSSSQTVKPCDRIKLTSSGATVDNEGQFIAFHPVNDSDEYRYVNCFQISLGGKGEKGDTGVGNYSFGIEIKLIEVFYTWYGKALV